MFLKLSGTDSDEYNASYKFYKENENFKQLMENLEQEIES